MQVRNKVCVTAFPVLRGSHPGHAFFNLMVPWMKVALFVAFCLAPHSVLFFFKLLCELVDGLHFSFFSLLLDGTYGMLSDISFFAMNSHELVRVETTKGIVDPPN